jgi:hypothetical protein
VSICWEARRRASTTQRATTVTTARWRLCVRGQETNQAKGFEDRSGDDTPADESPGADCSNSNDGCHSLSPATKADVFNYLFVYSRQSRGSLPNVMSSLRGHLSGVVGTGLPQTSDDERNLRTVPVTCFFYSNEAICYAVPPVRVRDSCSALQLAADRPLGVAQSITDMPAWLRRP